MSPEVAVALASLAVAISSALISFVISIAVKIGKLETRVDTNERDIDNLGAMYRSQKPKNDRRVA